MSPEPIPPAAQHADILGRNNVIVQIQGDGNKVLLGLPHLTLTRYLNRRQGGDGPSGEAAEILSPYALAIPFIGREPVMADLWTWMEKDQPVSVRVLTARGGGGKTRLALELCDDATRKGWFAGFVTDRELQRFLAQQNLSTWGWSRPTLIVVDDAASRSQLLRDWLIELADNLADSGHSLRLLLLERFADPNMGWWREAFGRGGGDARAVRRLLDPIDGPYILRPLTAPERRDVFTVTLERVGSALSPPETSDFDHRLAELSWGGEPLFLMMAGLTAVRAGLGHVLALNPTNVVFEVAEHELNRIREIGESRKIDPDFLAHMAAYVTLCQGLSRSQTEGAIEGEKRMLRYDSVGDPPRVYQALYDALPGSGSDVSPILPGILGEAVTLTALGAGDTGKAEDAVMRAVASGGERVLPVLIRTADDFGSVRIEALDWLRRWVRDGDRDDERLIQFSDQLPQQTLALRELAADLESRLVERFRRGDRKDLLAIGLNKLALRLSDLGRREEALEVGQEEVSLDRELASARPETFRPALAGSLNNLSTQLGNLGRWEEALEAVQEAVSLHRELASAGPETFRPALATSLNNLSTQLSNLGRWEEALEAIQEAVSLYRESASVRPETFRPALATSLNNLSTRLGDLGRWEEALKAGQEAASLYRELGSTRPEAFRPNLASSLNNLSLQLRALSRRTEALEAIQEAVSIQRELASARPEAFRPTLAGSLFNLSLASGEAGQNDRAVESCREAIELLIPFFLAIPAAFREEMVQIVGRYLDLVKEIGHRPDPHLLAPLVEAGFLKTRTKDTISPDETTSDSEEEPQ